MSPKSELSSSSQSLSAETLALLKDPKDYFHIDAETIADMNKGHWLLAHEVKEDQRESTFAERTHDAVRSGQYTDSLICRLVEKLDKFRKSKKLAFHLRNEVSDTTDIQRLTAYERMNPYALKSGTKLVVLHGFDSSPPQEKDAFASFAGAIQDGNEVPEYFAYNATDKTFSPISLYKAATTTPGSSDWTWSSVREAEALQAQENAGAQISN